MRSSVHAIIALFYAKKNKVDLVYTRSEWIALLFNLFGVRTFLELHQITNKIILYLITRFGQNIFLKSGIICISKGIVDTLREQGLTGIRLIVAHDAVDENILNENKSQAAAKETLGLSKDAKIAV